MEGDCGAARVNTTATVRPSETHAFVVGIEKYGAGHGWNLNGPAVDAARFVRWLRARGVPPGNIGLFAEPLDENREGLRSLDVAVRPADSRTVLDALGAEFWGRQGDLLFVLWGGHGVIGGDQRRLFFSDVAGNLLRSCNLPELLRSCRSMQGFSRQVFFVDACANYFELTQSPVGLADMPLPEGPLNTAASQFVLFSASAGERAANLSAQRTGAFSSCLLDELEQSSASAWPPDLAAVRAGVETGLLQLRASGRANQTPVSYSYTDWGGNEGTFRDVVPRGAAAGPRLPHAPPPAPVPPSAPPVGLEVADRNLLVASLLECDVMRSLARRDVIVADLGPDIANTIPRDPSSKFDVVAIVKTAARFRGGLGELIHIVRGYEGESDAAVALVELANRLGITGG